MILVEILGLIIERKNNYFITDNYKKLLKGQISLNYEQFEF